MIEHGWRLIALEVMPDHVHMFINAPTHESASNIARWVKGRASKYLRDDFSSLKKLTNVMESILRMLLQPDKSVLTPSNGTSRTKKGNEYPIQQVKTCSVAFHPPARSTEALTLRCYFGSNVRFMAMFFNTFLFSQFDW